MGITKTGKRLAVLRYALGYRKRLKEPSHDPR